MKLNPTDLELIADRLLALESSGALGPGASLADILETDYDQPPDKAFRTRLASIDLLFFLRFYLGAHFSKVFSPIHVDLAQELQAAIGLPGRTNVVIVMPRGFGKTSISTLGAPAWCACCGLRKFIMIISDSSEQANAQLENLKAELETNERIIEDFGPQRGDQWAAGRIVTAQGVRLEALGAGKKIRGRKFRQHRPDLMVYDDIENDQEVASDTQRESRKKWFYRAAMRAGWENTTSLVVGNLLHSECLLAELLDNPLWRRRKHAAVTSWAEREDLWLEWEAVLSDKSLGPDQRFSAAREFYLSQKAEMDRGAVSAWPEAFSYYDLMVIRTSEGHAAFSTELQNDPYDPSSSLFNQFSYYEAQLRVNDGQTDTWFVPKDGAPAVALSTCAVFGFTDPSLGKTQKSDYSALITLARAPDGRMFVVEADLARRSPAATIKRQNSLAAQYAYAKYGIETTQFQAFYYTESAAKARDAGVILPLEPVSQTRNKDVRIQSLEPDVNNGWILFKERGQGLLLEQLRGYGRTSYDDGPDALEGARTLAIKWQNLSGVQVMEGESYQFDYGTPSLTDRRLSMAVAVDPYSEYEEAVLPALYAHREVLVATLAKYTSDSVEFNVQMREIQRIEALIEEETVALDYAAPLTVF